MSALPWRMFDRIFLSHPRSIGESYPEHAATAFGFPRMHAYIDQLAAYTDAVLSGTPPPVSGTDGRAGVAAALALLEASRTGRSVSLR